MRPYPPRHADRVPGSLRLAVAAHVGRPTSSRKGCGCIIPACRRREREQARGRGADATSASIRRRAFRYPHEFSGGQRQRIAVARAIVLEPTFVVLDEPTSALDMLIQSQMVDLLRDLQKRHDLTYLFISHDLRVVAALASRLMVMRNGKVVEEGAAAELFKAAEERLHPRAVCCRLQAGDRARRRRGAMIRVQAAHGWWRSICVVATAPRAPPNLAPTSIPLKSRRRRVRSPISICGAELVGAALLSCRARSLVWQSARRCHACCNSYGPQLSVLPRGRPRTLTRFVRADKKLKLAFPTPSCPFSRVSRRARRACGR